MQIRLRGGGERGAGGFRLGNAAAFAYEVYERFQTKQQTVAVAVDLEDAYNRVQFNLPMDLLLQYGVSLTLTRWIAGALLEIRNCASGYASWELELCSSPAHNGPTTRITALAGSFQCIN